MESVHGRAEDVEPSRWRHVRGAMTPVIRVEAQRGAMGVEIVIGVRALDQTYSLTMTIAAAERLRRELDSAIDTATRILRGRA
jgi:hypothetical protein